jgi:hypothetical protein
VTLSRLQRPVNVSGAARQQRRTVSAGVPDALGFVAPVAYRTRSVLGGVLFHLGVAWAMELSAMWQ